MLKTMMTKINVSICISSIVLCASISCADNASDSSVKKIDTDKANLQTGEVSGENSIYANVLDQAKIKFSSGNLMTALKKTLVALVHLDIDNFREQLTEIGIDNEGIAKFKSSEKALPSAKLHFINEVVLPKVALMQVTFGFSMVDNGHLGRNFDRVDLNSGRLDIRMILTDRSVLDLNIDKLDPEATHKIWEELVTIEEMKLRAKNGIDNVQRAVISPENRAALLEIIGMDKEFIINKSGFSNSSPMVWNQELNTWTFGGEPDLWNGYIKN